jgi:hypothetical protein
MFGSGNLRSSEMNDFDIRIFLFSKGISNLKQVTSAGEWMGVVFCLVILAMSEEGIALLGGRFENSEEVMMMLMEQQQISMLMVELGTTMRMWTQYQPLISLSC